MNMHRRLSPLALGLILGAVCLPAQADSGASFTVKAFRITGSRAFSEAELLKLIEHSAGSQLSRSQLDGLADIITGFYRERGYARAHAVIPEQNFAEGIVRFLITTQPIRKLLRPAQDEAPLLPPPDNFTGNHEPIPMLLDRAKWWNAHDRTDYAQESVDKIFNIIPDHPDGLEMKARLEIRRNKPKEAQATLDTLRRMQPDHSGIPRIEALLRIIGPDKPEIKKARSLAKARLYHPAIAIFDKLFPDGPPSDDLALEYWQMVANTPKGWSRARNGFRQLSQDNPDNLRYRLALAEHETSRLPLNRKALQIIIDMTAMPAYSQQARQAWRNAMLTLGDTPSSLPLLRKYMVAEPNDSAVREKHILIARAQEQHRRLMADPNYRAGIEGLALLDRGELDAARPLLERALRARPKDADVTGGMGMLNLRQGQHERAQGYFAQADRLTPGGSQKWSSLVKVAKFWGLMREAREARDAGNFSLAGSRLGSALKMEPDNPDALAALARVQADQGNPGAAEITFRRALLIDPLNSDALQGLLALYRQQGMEQQVQQTIAGLSPAQRKAMGASLNRLESGLLQEQADRLLAQGRDDEAIALMERAVQTDADDPWSRFSLAKLYARHNRPEQGQALFDDFLTRHPDDPDALFALAQYQSNQGRADLALATLSRISRAQRNARIAHLWGDNLGQLAKTYTQTGRSDDARRALREAESRAGDEDSSLAIALAWAGIGENKEAQRIFDRLKSARTPPSTQWRLRHAEFLAMTDAPELRTELDVLAAMNSLTPAETQELQDLQESLAIRTANDQLRAGKPALARETIAPLLLNTPNRITLLLIEAGAYRDEGQWALALGKYNRVLELEPDEPDARRGLIETLLVSGDRTAALAQLDKWSPAEATGNVSGRLQLADWYLALDEPSQAEEQLEAVLAQHPGNADALNQAWQIAQQNNRLDDQIVYLKKALAAEQLELLPQQATAQNTALAWEQVGHSPLGAPEKIQRNWKEKKLAALIDRRTDWLSSAIDMRSRSGTPGLSQYRSTEIPVEYRTPWRQHDEVFFRADLVRLEAGSVDPTSSDFGAMLVCQPLCAPNLLAQSAQGAGFTAGYHSDTLRADIGITPTGFPVSNIVGSVRVDGDFGQLSYSLEASRRPVTGSLLSFAGARDPHTGQVWGGVVATGGRLGLSLDKGERFGFWSSLGLHRLTGRNVLDNNRLQLMAGGQQRIINEENRLFSVGLTGMYWRHSENAGEYTFGHGGYYSPQDYRSLSVPLTYGERYPRFSWVLRAAVSVSQSKTQSAPYFPTDAQLQAQAVALTPVNFITPVYDGGSGSGTGYSLRAAWEYQVTQQLFVGGQFSLERSEDYAPNRALFYLRYALDQPAAQPVYFQPVPVEPSSQF